jgi:hypothetical protein
MRASDLRIRIEIGSTGELPAWEKCGEDRFLTKLGETRVLVQALHGAMDGFADFRWSLVQDGNTVGLDYILYEGEPAEIDFHTMEEALFMFALKFSGPNEKPEMTTAVTSSNDSVRALLEAPEQPITLTLAKKPADRAVLFHA